MLRIKWNKSYLTGIEKIDSQHKKLVDIINTLEVLVHQQLDPKINRHDSVEQVLEALISYTKVHFRYEEGLLKESGYPDYLSHKKIHDQMTDKIKMHIRHFKEEKGSVEALLSLLVQWLTHHIQDTDKKYVEFLLSKKSEEPQQA